MDKYEFKVRSEEIDKLIREGDYAAAVEIADTIDWSKVKSIKTLCRISDLYKANRRYQESKEILLMAYQRYPTGRLIVYSLCELSIKLDELIQATEYYKEFQKLAPSDTNRYILQYRIGESVDLSLEERVGILEEFKSKDYREKWGYELAYLYHRMGLASKCVDECEELIVTFGRGKYVLKALELKAKHEPLSPSEQKKYDELTRDHRGTEPVQTEEDASQVKVRESISDVGSSTDNADLQGAPTTELPKDPQEMDIQVKTVDVGQYNTINLQEALAESMKEILDKNDEDSMIPSTPEEDIEDNTIFGTSPMAGHEFAQTPEPQPEPEPVPVPAPEPVPVQIPQPEPAPEPEYEPAPAPELVESTVLIPDIEPALQAKPVITPEIMSGDTKRIDTDNVVDYLESQRLMQEMQEASASMKASTSQAELIPGAVTGQLDTADTISSAYDQMLAEEYSGQIRLAIYEAEQVEKQITGQLSIDDVLADWENTKLENEKKREEEVRQRIMQHTGSLFDEFDEDTKASLIEQLEKAFTEAIMKESRGGVVDANLGKKIRKEALRAVEYMTMDGVIGKGVAEIAETMPTPVIKAEPEEKAEPAKIEEPEEEKEEKPVEEQEEKAEEEVEAEAEADEADETADETADGSGEPEEVSEGVPDGTDSLEVAAVREALREDEEEAAGKERSSETKVSTGHGGNETAESSDEDESSDGSRALNDDEIELFGPYLTRKSTKRQICHALDNMSMASYTGNVIVTGEEGVGTIDLAKKLIKYMQAIDSNFVNPQVAKVSGKGLNDKDIAALFEKIKGGAIIIESARGMKKSTVQKLMKVLENENLGVLAILEDTSDGMDRIVGTLPKLGELFNVRIDLKALDDKALVDYACEYALSQEHTIDEFALLALHTRIAEMQTSTHQVSVGEVRDLVDDAIYYADKKNLTHLFDIILHKRYDEEDMIILREKDFMHY
ncbi:MAG: hypothetical protein K6F54_10290 [Lachnospiraceae bacterium]|nr:hypothetical protein [Lachnospiraceae bacterium]